MDIGFTQEPNAAWNASSASLGFWYREFPNEGDDVEGHRYDPDLLEKVHEGCQWYSDAFEETFIQNDRTWKVSRIMARVAGGGSFASAILSWTFVGPFFCPVHFLWPGVLLPLVMISFIAEGSKFLFFDMSICRNNLFKEAGTDEGTAPESAESCSLGDNAIQTIVAVVLLLVALLLVCLKVPDERQLDPHFGIPDEGTDPSEEDEYHHSLRGFPGRSIRSSKQSLRKIKSLDELPTRSAPRPRDETSEYSSEDYPEDYAIPVVSKEHDFVKPANPYPPLSKRDLSNSNNDSSFQSRSALDASFQSNNDPMHVRHHSVDELLGDIEEESSSSPPEPILGNSSMVDMDDTRISESRLSTLASVEKKAAGSGEFSTASSMLEDLVRDLNYSYSNPPPQRDGGALESPAHSSSRHRQYP